MKKNARHSYLSLMMLICFLTIVSNYSFGQVGMMGNMPDKSSALDIDATNKGLLVPRIQLQNLTDKSSIEGGNPSESLWVYNTNDALTGGTGHFYWDGNRWQKLITDGNASNDNLGNHTATTVLDMTMHDVNNVAKSHVYNELQIHDQVSSNAKHFGFYKNSGTLGIWNDYSNTNELSIDESSGKTTLNNLQVEEGTNNSNPQPGLMVTSADASGNIVFTAMAKMIGGISGVYETIGVTPVTIAQGAVQNITDPASLTIELTQDSYVLITYSALGLPANAAQPVQGSIDLIVDSTKEISSFYSGSDAPAVLTRLGTYSSSQKMISLPAGTHNIYLQAKSWNGSTRFNYNPSAISYPGSSTADNGSMNSRITAVVFNK